MYWFFGSFWMPCYRWLDIFLVSTISLGGGVWALGMSIGVSQNKSHLKVNFSSSSIFGSISQ